MLLLLLYYMMIDDIKILYLRHQDLYWPYVYAAIDFF
jgi:hypothetical protein